MSSVAGRVVFTSSTAGLVADTIAFLASEETSGINGEATEVALGTVE